jgi:hypothetical protein
MKSSVKIGLILFGLMATVMATVVIGGSVIVWRVFFHSPIDAPSVYRENIRESIRWEPDDWDEMEIHGTYIVFSDMIDYVGKTDAEKEKMQATIKADREVVGAVRVTGENRFGLRRRAVFMVYKDGNVWPIDNAYINHVDWKKSIREQFEGKTK